MLLSSSSARTLFLERLRHCKWNSAMHESQWEQSVGKLSKLLGCFFSSAMLKSTIIVGLLISKNGNGYDIPSQFFLTVCWDILPFGLFWTGCSGCWEHNIATDINFILLCLAIKEWANSWSSIAARRKNECFWPSGCSNCLHSRQWGKLRSFQELGERLKF